MGWSVDEVAAYVRGFAEFEDRAIEYADKMAKERIDGEALVELTDHDLREEMEMALGHRKKFLKHVAELSATAQPPSTISSDTAAAHPQPHALSGAAGSAGGAGAASAGKSVESILEEDLEIMPKMPPPQSTESKAEGANAQMSEFHVHWEEIRVHDDPPSDEEAGENDRLLRPPEEAQGRGQSREDELLEEVRSLQAQLKGKQELRREERKLRMEVKQELREEARRHECLGCLIQCCLHIMFRR